jgi:hypothetical protein
MKASIKIALVLMLSSSLSVGHAQSWFGQKVSGSGNVTTKTISTENYDAIEAAGFMDVHLKKGTEGQIIVTTDDNLQEYVEIEVKSNKLVIKTKKGYNLKTQKGIHITVPFEDISKVTLTGSGDIESKDLITANEFNASLFGSGDLKLAVKSPKVQVIIAGSGDVTMSGSTSNLAVELSGSGDFKGFDIESQSSNVSVSGSGDVKVVAKKNLVARVSGSGDVVYKGNPEKKDVKVLGSGNISPL